MKRCELLRLCGAFSERTVRREMRETFGLPLTPGAAPLDAFYARWPIGGLSGGDAWGATPAAFIAEELEPDFEGLEQLLCTCFPQLRHSAYRALHAHIVRGSYTEHGLHGNCTFYATKKLPFEALLPVLQAEGLLQPE